jgi:hypothetical protein
MENINSKLKNIELERNFWDNREFYKEEMTNELEKWRILR